MEKQPITIRYAAAPDNVLLAELGAQTFYEAFAASNAPENIAAYLAGAFTPEQLAIELADAAAIFLIAEAAGTAVGYAKLQASEPAAGITGQQPMELVRIYVQQAWIGQRIGAALMAACLQEAQRHDHDTLWLGVWEENPQAIAFYRKWGFVEVGTQLFYLGGQAQTDLLMQRLVVMEYPDGTEPLSAPTTPGHPKG
jgi:diamine N-acetyltransferase